MPRPRQVRISADLAVRAVNFLRTEGLNKDDTMICFDKDEEEIILEDFRLNVFAKIPYNRPRQKVNF